MVFIQCYVILFYPSLYIHCCCSVFLFCSSLYILCCCYVLLFSLYPQLLLCPFSPLLFIFPAAAKSSCSLLLFIFPSAAMSSFLAHLSRRLMGELIVYQSLRRPSVRPSSVRPSVRPSVRQHFQTCSPLKPLGQLNSNFIWRLLRTRERKFIQMVLVT